MREFKKSSIEDSRLPSSCNDTESQGCSSAAHYANNYQASCSENVYVFRCFALSLLCIVMQGSINGRAFDLKFYGHLVHYDALVFLLLRALFFPARRQSDAQASRKRKAAHETVKFDGVAYTTLPWFLGKVPVKSEKARISASGFTNPRLYQDGKLDVDLHVGISA